MKNNYQTQKISSNFHIDIIPPTREIALSDALNERIEKIWSDEVQQFGAMRFNGKILNFIECTPDSVKGHFIEYKWLVAERRDHEIEDELQIIPVGVSGLIRCGDLILAGKRSNAVAEYPGMWEFVPAGGITPRYVIGEQVDYQLQLLEELEEETGISRHLVKALHPFLLVLDEERKILDICIELEVDSSILTKEFPVGEYSEFRWISISTFESLECEWVTSSLAIMREIMD